MKKYILHIWFGSSHLDLLLTVVGLVSPIGKTERTPVLADAYQMYGLPGLVAVACTAIYSTALAYRVNLARKAVLCLMLVWAVASAVMSIEWIVWLLGDPSFDLITVGPYGG